MDTLKDTTVLAVTAFTVIVLTLLLIGGCGLKQQAYQQPQQQGAASQPGTQKELPPIDAGRMIPKKNESTPLSTQDQKVVTLDEVSSHSLLYQEGVDATIIKNGQRVTERIAVYGVSGLRFPARDLVVDRRAKLRTSVIIIETAKGGFLIPKKNSAVPVNIGFDENAKFGLSFFTHAINTKWKFAKQGIRFDVGDSTYESERAGASISFTEDGVKMDGIRQIGGTKAGDKSKRTGAATAASEQSEGIPQSFLGRWIALDNKDHYVLVTGDVVRWERGDIEGPEIIALANCKVSVDKQSVSFPVRSSAGALVGGKIARGTMTVTMTLTNDSLTISEDASDTIKDTRSGFVFQQTGRAKHVFRKVQEKKEARQMEKEQGTIFSFWRQTEDSQASFLGFEPKTNEVIIISKNNKIDGYADGLGIHMMQSDISVDADTIMVRDYNLSLSYQISGDTLTMRTRKGKTMKYRRLTGTDRQHFVDSLFDKPKAIVDD